VESKLFAELKGSYTSEWSDGLAFLRSFELTPPPFCQPLTTKIKFHIEQAICDTFLSVISVCDEGLKPHPNPKHHSRADFSSWELLLLAILFERLVLFPISNNPTAITTKSPSPSTQSLGIRKGPR
jgi:hypothetical protein